MTEFELGIQSYCFRKFLPIPELIGALEQAGLANVEIWPKHLHWTTPLEERNAALAAFAARGIAVNAYGQVHLRNDEAEARPMFAFARDLDLRAFTANPAPDAIALMDGLAEEYGVNVAVHNHGRNHQYGRFDQLQAIFQRSSRRVGLCLDTAWFLDAGCDPLQAVDLFGERLYGVHLKDFVFDDEGGHRDVIIGTGGLDLPGLLRRLEGVGFDGYLSIEYEGDPDDPLPQVIECVQAIRSAIAEM